MEQLPDDIILLILKNLNTESLWNALKSTPILANSFSSSSKHLKDFQLEINAENIESRSNDLKTMKIPFKNVKIEGFALDDGNFLAISRVVESFKDSVEILELKSINFQDKFLEFMSSFPSLSSISFEECRTSNDHVDHYYYYDSGEDESGDRAEPAPEIPQIHQIVTLKSISFNSCGDSLFQPFKNQNSIEKVTVHSHSRGINFNSNNFNEFAKTLPNFQHLVMLGVGAALYFDFDSFPYKIKKLEATLVTFDWSRHTPRISFFESQKGHLKELIMQKFPYDYDGGAVLKYIIEEMKLDSFHCGGQALILNGEKQQIKEFLVFEVGIHAAFEMFRQYPSVETFNLFLTQTGLNMDTIGQIINPPTNLFKKVRHLNIIDHSGWQLFASFKGLYKNFTEVTKVTWGTDDGQLKNVLLEVMPYMTQLNEIAIGSAGQNVVESFDAIRTSAPGIKKLSVGAMFVDQAKEFFRDTDIEIIGN